MIESAGRPTRSGLRRPGIRQGSCRRTIPVRFRRIPIRHCGAVLPGRSGGEKPGSTHTAGGLMRGPKPLEPEIRPGATFSSCARTRSSCKHSRAGEHQGEQDDQCACERETVLNIGVTVVHLSNPSEEACPSGLEKHCRITPALSPLQPPCQLVFSFRINALWC